MGAGTVRESAGKTVSVTAGMSAKAAERAAERARALRAARTEALARRGLGRAEAAQRRAYLVCACGAERYGLPLAEAAGVLPMRPCTPVPGAVPALLGLAAVSGRIVSVLDLARALGRPGAGAVPGGAPGGHLVVLRTGAVPVALAVDRVVGIAEIDADTASPEADSAHPSPGGMGAAAVSGYAPAESEGGDFVVLDLPRLLRRALP